jgi:tetratricopeptide (TPR) repeat protein
MNPRISAVLGGVLLAAFGIFAVAPQTKSKADPVEAARLNNLGAAYMNQQLFEKGLKCFQQAEELDPKLTIARLNEGIAYLNLQKLDEASAALENVLKLDPKSPQAWYNLGLLAKNTGDAQTAIDDFKRVTEIDSNDADTWYFLGASYSQARQFLPAIDAFQRALKLNPFHASAEFGLSRAYQQSGKVDLARENLTKFQNITQKKLGAPISLAYGEQGQYSRAVESPQAVLKPRPQIKVRFVDVTKEAGLLPAQSGQSCDGQTCVGGPGACFLDYEDDGRIDLFLAENFPQGMSLYHNLGSGKFQLVSSGAGLDVAVHAQSCTAADYDNDGYEDLAVFAGSRILLLHNQRDETFRNASPKAGLADSTAEHGTFIDYDHDGDVDLYTGFNGFASGANGEHKMWRNNANGTFTDTTVATGLEAPGFDGGAIGTDYNNDRAVDLVVTGTPGGGVIGGIAQIPVTILENRREGKFAAHWFITFPAPTRGVSVLDFDHDGWMDLAFTHDGPPGLTLWRNNHGKSFEQVKLPEINWARAFGVAAFDYDNDGWVDLVAVGETKEGKGEIKLFRNLGPDGFKDVTADVGLDKIHLEHPRAIITGDYDNDGAVDLLITQNQGPPVLLRNEGGNQNHWLRLALKGVADNKSAIGTKVEVFAGGNRQKFEIYGSNGYLGQNSPYLTVGLGDAKQADVVRLLWPTGVLQDEINVAGDKQQNITEIDRRGSSCPTLFVWNGKRYEFVADMLGAGVVGHWVGPVQRDVPRPVEWIKIDRDMIQEKKISNSSCHPERSEGSLHFSDSCIDPSPPKPAAQDDKPLPMTSDKRLTTVLSFRFMEPLEEAVYLDRVRLLAVDHRKGVDVYPNEYFASNPPYPKFKVVISREAHAPAGAWDDHGHDVLPDLLAHRYFGDFALTQFVGFAKPHSLTLDLGKPYRGGPLWLLMHGEVEYFSANSMYAASQAGVHAISPYVEALGAKGKWSRVINDMGFPAGGPRTMTADLSGKLPVGTQKIRITTNLQIYWDSILIDRTQQPVEDDSRSSAGKAAREIPRRAGASARLRDDAAMRVSEIPLIRADLEFHGYPYKIEGTPPGNVNYIYEKASATGPYTRPAGNYTRYGDVLPLLTKLDDQLAVFGSGDEVQLDFDPGKLPALPSGWVRDYFFAAYGYEKDMDFYAADGNFVAPLPFLSMKDYPYAPKQSFPLDDTHLNYLLEYNTRHMSGNEQRGYAFEYPSSDK